MIVNKIKQFVKSETVLCIASILAIVSAFFVTPDMKYLEYIDFRTLALLFCLMTVMAGLQKNGLFSLMAESLLRKVSGIKSLTFILVMLCFFTSMFITNDVALITFVPFTFTVLDKLDGDIRSKMIIPITVMQTIAANLGSMLAPIGNPQNLYLQGISGMGISEFILLMLPYTAVSFVILAVWSLSRKNNENSKINFENKTKIEHKVKTVIYGLLFGVCLMTVARVIDYRIALVAVIVVVAVIDYKIFMKVDYTLLLTFVAFFVFIGNMGRISAFSDYIRSIISGHECVTGVIASQFISNVPAALLLSCFTDNLKPLIVGVNLGGLGTFIASMASLISFKYIGRENKKLRGKYMIYFTTVNVIFLVVLLFVYYIFV